jgi:TetR/AcrR family transcriptional repressor of nem operon
MTDLAQRAGKRERLIAAARTLFHEQGVHVTTLAEVAQRAEVPPGNVYYYFKAKEDLVHAVVDDYVGQADAMLAELDRLRSPSARLKSLTRSWLDVADTVADHGCPVGSLCAELNRCEGPLARAGAEILGRISDWAESQFRQLNRRDAKTFHDATIMNRQARHLERWIDTIS